MTTISAMTTVSLPLPPVSVIEGASADGVVVAGDSVVVLVGLRMAGGGGRGGLGEEVLESGVATASIVIVEGLKMAGGEDETGDITTGGGVGDGGGILVDVIIEVAVCNCGILLCCMVMRYLFAYLWLVVCIT